MKQGLVQIYSGEGKGKTTAAAGLAMRASGRGLGVIFIQFLKSGDSGEIHCIRKNIPGIEVLSLNSQGKFIWNMNETELEGLKNETREGFDRAADIARNGLCDLLILDEIFGALGNGFITIDEILKLIRNRSSGTELVLTGRGAPPEIIEAADLVTEMKKIKHPFDSGIDARRGIEL